MEAVAKDFLALWLPVMARHGEDVRQDPIVELLEGHAHIRGLVMQLSDAVVGGDVRPETLREIGERLEAHIRLEERVVFPMIEDSLLDAALAELADRLEAKAAGPRVEPWVPAEELSYAPWPGPGDSEGGGYDWPSRRSPR